MSRRIAIYSGAASDMKAAAAWYESETPGLGDDFLRLTEETFERIRAFPEAFSPIGKDFCRARVRRFPYIVYFRLAGSTVKIYAILHTSRSPRVWQARNH